MEGWGACRVAATPFPLNSLIRLALMNRYLLLGVSVIALMSVVSVFTDESDPEYAYIGVAHDINETANGYTFTIDVSTGCIRCFAYTEPVDLGCYGVRGSMSSDGTMFFISSMHLLDEQD